MATFMETAARYNAAIQRATHEWHKAIRAAEEQMEADMLGYDVVVAEAQAQAKATIARAEEEVRTVISDVRQAHSHEYQPDESGNCQCPLHKKAAEGG